MLEIGDKAPDFSGMDAEGNTLRLSDFKGRKLVLYFYPKDNTSGCTAEACDLRDNYERFLAQGYSIVGVSKDSADSHRKFAQKHSLPFPLIADTDRKILQDYQAWGEKTLYGKKTEGTLRKTYVIDENGVIEKVFEKAKPDTNAQEILDYLDGSQG